MTWNDGKSGDAHRSVQELAMAGQYVRMLHIARCGCGIQHRDAALNRSGSERRESPSLESAVLVVKRAKSLLGTRVSSRLDGLSNQDAHHMIDRSFVEIERIHRLMSFNEDESDASRLNRTGMYHKVEVDESTFAVLSLALQLSSGSSGTFDITVARTLAARDASGSSIL